MIERGAMILASPQRRTVRVTIHAANSCFAACHSPTQVPRVRIPTLSVPTLSVGRSAKRWWGVGERTKLDKTLQVLVRSVSIASSEHTAPSRGSYIALNSLARFALNDVFLIKIPSKGKKTIVSCMIKDVHVSIFLSINVKMRDESVRTCWPSSRPMPPSRTHPLVPRFTRSHA